jgi:hypothetical protein
MAKMWPNPFLYQNYCLNFTVEKAAQKCGLLLYFRKTAQSKQLPMGEIAPNLVTLPISEKNSYIAIKFLNKNMFLAIGRFSDSVRTYVYIFCQ